MVISLRKRSITTFSYILFVFITVMFNSSGHNLICNALFLLFAVFSLQKIVYTGIKLTKEEWWLLIFVIVVLSSAMGVGFSLGWLKQVYSCTFHVVSVVLATNVFDRDAIPALENCIIAGALILGFYALINYKIYGGNVRLGDNIKTNSITMGITLAFAAIILMKKIVKDNLLWAIPVLGIDLMLLMFTKSRGPMSIGIAGCGLLYLFGQNRTDNKRKTRRVKVILLFLILLFLLIGIESGLFQQYFSRFEEFFRVIRFERNSRSSSSGVRLYLKELGFREFLKKPVFGHGAGSAQEFLNGSFFHDNFIEIAYQYGIIGFIAYYIPLAGCMVDCVRKKNEYSAIMLFCLIADGVFDVVFHAKLFYIILALCLMYNYERPRAAERDEWKNYDKNPSFNTLRFKICRRGGSVFRQH